MKRTIAMLMLVSLTALGAPALARPVHPPTPPDRMDDHRVRSAPEIDPSVAAGALALLGGGLLVLRSRRRR